MQRNLSIYFQPPWFICLQDLVLRTVWQGLGSSDLADRGRSGMVQKKIDSSEEKL